MVLGICLNHHFIAEQCTSQLLDNLWPEPGRSSCFMLAKPTVYNVSLGASVLTPGL
jgi:hypothetical protein